MLRIICVQSDCAAAANVGGPVEVSHKTFDIECDAAEEWLKEVRQASYVNRSVAGVEVLPETPHN